jgi:Arc/MetJ family transcription regulator
LVVRYAWASYDRHMAGKLKRKSFFIDERELREARRALGVTTDAEAVRAALREVARMKTLARFMERSRGSVPPGSFSRP